MASALSDSDSVPPTEFPVFSSDDELLDKASAGCDKCPVCRNSRQYYYCANCIRNGNFSFSNSSQGQSDQRFIEKKLALLKLQGEIKEFVTLAEFYLNKRNKCHILAQEIKFCKEKIKILRKWKEDVEKNIAKDIEVLKELGSQKKESICNLKQLGNKLTKVDNHYQRQKTNIDCHQNHLDSSNLQLGRVIRENVTHLFQCIFPITKENQTNSEEESESLATVNALADASRTAYIRGHWVYADTDHSEDYSIVDAHLPGTGDMLAYQLCVAKADKENDQEAVRHFKVALSHTTQLCNVLAFYFGVRLPKKVAHLDFIRNDLDTKKFAGRISRLHKNILFLCTSQGASLAGLRHSNPLPRLLALVDCNVCLMGRYCPYEYYPEFWSFEDAAEEDGAAEDSTSEDDSDPLNADWESVVQLPTIESSGGRTSQSSSGTSIETPVAASVVGGVVASLWKAWPWPK